MFPVEAFRNTLVKAVEVLERHSIRFHLTGGLTSVYYGEPRMTQDVDIVIDNHNVALDLEPFLASLNGTDFMFDTSSIRHAVEHHGMFQLLDRVESLKLDLYPRELIAGELDRSQQVEVIKGLTLPIASRADAAASKLVWVSKGSHKSRRDLRHIWRTSSVEDTNLIRNLATTLNLGPLLEEVLHEPDEIID